MGLGDFGLSILASWLANKIDFKKSAPENISSKSDEAPQKEKTSESPKAQKFKTFDAWNDLSRILTAVKSPVISILIEDEPSTHYHLPSMVLESSVTGEWYVFSRGRMSFEGNGGGIRNSQEIIDQVKAAGANIGTWVVTKSEIEALDNGYITWPKVKQNAIPLLARVARDYTWDEIERNVTKQIK
ncbi:hypothetical protein EYS42_16750 [Aquabacterium lacunae]|uniref:Uncharacterized protein n=2 Tax=Aquabacterium lacunae TaxID=2528630 RepID=A0A4Q9GV92_9BURK|nr:hypothetical protein EYS42_16750 [Aquabacterium lacunae]